MTEDSTAAAMVAEAYRRCSDAIETETDEGWIIIDGQKYDATILFTQWADEALAGRIQAEHETVYTELVESLREFHKSNPSTVPVLNTRVRAALAAAISYRKGVASPAPATEPPLEVLYPRYALHAHCGQWYDVSVKHMCRVASANSYANHPMAPAPVRSAAPTAVDVEALTKDIVAKVHCATIEECEQKFPKIFADDVAKILPILTRALQRMEGAGK